MRAVTVWAVGLGKNMVSDGSAARIRLQRPARRRARRIDPRIAFIVTYVF
ncbi:hypothetical protein [Rhizobium leguminosarum]|nr:hypothetical protein [Rhizobium leguminosarum]MBP2444745.1 hypothetical protein [Rhizobium leguminosarum]